VTTPRRPARRASQRAAAGGEPSGERGAAGCRQTLFGDGLAAGPDLEDAAERAVRQAVGPLDGPPALVCVFVSGAGADDAVRAGLRAMAVAAGAGDGGTTVLGCTASGVIGGERGVQAGPAVSAWATALPGVRVTPFRLDTSRTGDGLLVTGMPAPSPEDRIAVLLADPFGFPVDAFVQHSADELGGLPIAGGLAAPATAATSPAAAGQPSPSGADGGAAQLFLDGEVYRGGAVGVLLGGPVEVATVVSQGCRPVGPAMAVTGAAGGQVAELAGTRALEKLDEVVGGLPDEERKLAASGIHLGIAIDEYADEHERGDFLVRPVIGADPDTGTLTVGDVVEVGQTVRFQVRDAATAAADLDRLLTVFGPVSGIDPVGGALLFSCHARGASLFDSPGHDVLAVRRALAPQAAGGFFAAGEIGPVGGRNHVHGYTASMLVFGCGWDSGE
jgi:small ligand-binding sensory domain FIST